MNHLSIVFIVLLLFVNVWMLHGMDIEYYTHASSYNEEFDNNLKVSLATTAVIVTLLLTGDSEPIYTGMKNN